MNNDKEKQREYSARWRKNNLERSRAQQRKAANAKNARMRADPIRHAKYKEYQKNVHMKRLYGITVAEKEAMMKGQNGLCLACASPFSTMQDGFRNPVVDHDHKTGKVRGILHNKCNRALGIFGDDIDGVMRVLAYLQRQQ
jgi:hypothetical protein